MTYAIDWIIRSSPLFPLTTLIIIVYLFRIFFDPPHYTVMENIGSFNVTIVREGGDLNLPVQVDYKTEDGTACSPDDYSGVAGTLTFGPGETEKTVELSVEDDDLFEEDEHFYIRVSNPR